MKRPKTSTIAAGKFKAECLALIDKVSRTNETLVITKHGKPVAQLVPLDQKLKSKSLRGSLIFDDGDLSPIGTQWGAQK